MVVAVVWCVRKCGAVRSGVYGEGGWGRAGQGQEGTGHVCLGGPGWSRVAWMGRVRWDGYGWGWVKGLHCVCMRLHECEAAMELDGVAEKIADEQCRNKE